MALSHSQFVISVELALATAGLAAVAVCHTSKLCCELILSLFVLLCVKKENR